MKLLIFLIFVGFIHPIYTQPISEKWIKSTRYLDSSGVNKIEDITYYNGLGLVSAYVSLKGSGTGKDLILPYYYDSGGRVNSKVYLPFAKTNSNQNHLDNIFVNQKNYYLQNFGENVYTYSENVFELSALNRISKAYNVGQVYRTADKFTEYIYETNITNDNVLSFTFNSSNGFSVTQPYTANSLYKTTLVDEDGKTVISFTDFENKLILTRNKLSDSENVDVYYVYDEMNRLRVIITPEGGKQLRVNQSYNPTDAFVLKYCYLYNYDGKNRLIEKKIPGKGIEEMVYDKMGRLVLYRDRNMASKNHWHFSLYNNIDLVVKESIINSSQSRSIFQASYDNFNNKFDKTNNYYDRPLKNSQYNIVAVLVERVYGGDNFTKPSYLNFQPQTDLSADKVDNRMNGLVTYVKEYILDDYFYGTSANFIERAYYYDSNGRIIQEVEKNHLNGISLNSYVFDFSGNVIKHYESHQYENAIPIVTVREYAYDSRSRLLSQKTKINNNEIANVSYGYNDLGYLVSKTYGSGSNAFTENFEYNLQGWMTNQTSSNFDYQLKYYNSTSAPPVYSGKISEINWTHKNLGNNQNRYAFYYDKLGRYKNVTHFENSVQTNKYIETIDSYDYNGNVNKLTRKSNNSQKINEYTYNGDFLTSLKISNVPHAFTYDNNGNCTRDGRKSLDFEYNLLNHIQKVKTNGQIVASYSWGIDGAKKTVKDQNNTGFEYLGSYTYKRTHGQLILESIPFNDGRIYCSEISSGIQYTAKYMIKDHLGSVRQILVNNQVEEVNDYYPFGLEWENQYTPTSNNRYKFNGKEKQTTGNVNYLDYGARMYDPEITRWFILDPLADKYLNISPFAYCANNPINHIDPDGKKIRIVNSYSKTMSNLARIAATSEGKIRIDALIKHDDVFNVESVFWRGNSDYTHYNRTISYTGYPIRAGHNGKLASYYILSHELDHAYRNRDKDDDLFFYDEIVKDEGSAIRFENYMRTVYGHGKKLRTYYSGIPGVVNPYANARSYNWYKEEVKNFKEIYYAKYEEATIAGYSYDYYIGGKSLGKRYEISALNFNGEYQYFIFTNIHDYNAKIKEYEKKYKNKYN